MENKLAKVWLSEKANASAGYNGQKDPVVILAKRWTALQKERVTLYHATRECAGVSQACEVVVIEPEKLASLWQEIHSKEASMEQIENASSAMIEADGRCLADIVAEYSELDRKRTHCTNMLLSAAESEAEKAAFQSSEAKYDSLRNVMRLYRNELAALQVPVFDLPIPSEDWFRAETAKPRDEPCQGSRSAKILSGVGC